MTAETTPSGVNTEKARHQISPIPFIVYIGGVVTFIICPLWMMFVGSRFSGGFHMNSWGMWVGFGIFAFMVVFGLLFRVVLVTPIRFHEGPPPQDAGA